MNVLNCAGSRLSYSARLRANFSLVVASLQHNHGTPTNSSYDTNTEGLIGGLVKEIDIPVHQPHPPFDLSRQSSQSSLLHPGARKLAKRSERAVVSTSEGAMARMYSSSLDIVQTLKSSHPDDAPDAKSTKKKLLPKKKFVGVKAPHAGKPKKSRVFRRLFQDDVEVKHSDIREKRNVKPFSVKSRWEGEDWQENWGPDRLKPPPKPQSSPPKFKKRPSPPHIRSVHKVPIPYTRRIEGLLSATDDPVLTDLPSVSEHRPIAKLAHGLDRVLFNPGVHWLQDPRSRVYNFPTWLEKIPKVTDFAFERLAGFIKSSRDEDLWSLAKRENRTFAGSTSSLTGMLSQIYFLISGDKHVDISVLSQCFEKQPTTFTPGQRMPSSIVMNYKDGVYAIDSDSDRVGGAEKNILTWMGTLLEKYLTMSPDEFTMYMRASPPPPEEESGPIREAYRYAKSGRFVMRSQLDCHDSRLPGTGVFDIKTRACLPIRLDVLNYEENSGYLIRSQHGPLESFEKEYYDLIRSAFLKYSFQARIGNMDGVIVAYHNTARMFGFQYIPLEEMDGRIFGPGVGTGDRVFKKCIGLLEVVADEIIRCFPNQSVKCTFETEEDMGAMNVWIEPAEWTGDQARPIRQLEVKSSSYIRHEPVRGAQAVSAIDTPWTVHWTVCLLSADDAVVRHKLAAAKDRQFRAYSLPSGITLEKMAEFWKNLNFSGKATEAEPPDYNPDIFRRASRGIEVLRSIARAGKEETERLELEEAGKPKIVLGEPENLSEQEIEAFSDRTLAADDEPVVDSSLSPTDELPVVAAVDGMTAGWPDDGVEQALHDKQLLDNCPDANQDISEQEVTPLQKTGAPTSSESYTLSTNNDSQPVVAPSPKVAELHDNETTPEEMQPTSVIVNAVEPLPAELTSSTVHLSSDQESASVRAAPADPRSLSHEAESELLQASRTISEDLASTVEVVLDDAESSCPSKAKSEPFEVSAEPKTTQ